MAIQHLLRTLFGGAPRRPGPDDSDVREDPWGALSAALTGEWSVDARRRVCVALRVLDRRGPVDLTRLAALLGPWYAAHPIEPRWLSEHDLFAFDPLDLDINDVAAGPDDPRLPTWARLLRALAVVDDGALVFHHGFTAADLLGVLRDPQSPRYEALRVGTMVDVRDADAAAILDHIAVDPSMSRLRHLGLGGGPFGPAHVVALLASERAWQLRSLDLCERLLDHDDDAVVDALGRMGRLREIEHLCLYNDVHTARHLRALVARDFPRLTHLSLGHAAVDDAYVDVLCACDSFPALKALSLSPWDPRLTAWAESRGIARACAPAAAG